MIRSGLNPTHPCLFVVVFWGVLGGVCLFVCVLFFRFVCMFVFPFVVVVLGLVFGWFGGVFFLFWGGCFHMTRESAEYTVLNTSVYSITPTQMLTSIFSKAMNQLFLIDNGNTGWPSPHYGLQRNLLIIQRTKINCL